MNFNTQMPTVEQQGDPDVGGSNTQSQPADLAQLQDRRHDSRNDQTVNESVAPEFEPMIQVIDKIHVVDKKISMKYEMLRFSTFQLFPKENKTYIIRLAQAGFYYAGNGDEVLCYCCGIRKSAWQEADVPLDIHRELNPNCTFLLENLKVNVPVKQQSSCANWTHNTISASAAASECNEGDRVQTKHTFTSASEPSSSDRVSQQSDMHLGIATTSFQNNPEMPTSLVSTLPAPKASVSQENMPSSGLTSTANKATNTDQSSAQINRRGGSRECITANRLVEKLLEASESESSQTLTPVIADTTASASQTYVQNSGKCTSNKHTEQNEDKTSRSGQRDDNTILSGITGTPAGHSELERFLTKLWRGFGESKDILEINCKMSVAGITLEPHDFDSLRDNEWLHDTIIDSLLRLLHWRQCRRPSGNRIYVMLTCVGNLWSHGLFNTCIYEKVQLTNYTWVFVPFNVNENHWVLLTVHMPTRVVRVYDSLHEDNHQCFDMWVTFMSERAKHVSHDSPSDWTFHNRTNLSARQIDGSSCGAFVLLNTKAITDGDATQELDQEHALAMRHFVRCKLLKASRKSESQNTVCHAKTCKIPVQSPRLIECEACFRSLHLE